MNQGIIQLLFRLLIICCLIPGSITAQHLDFQYAVNETNGLSYPYIKDILIDHQDYLWIATSYGLNRYDGSTLTNYFYNPLDTGSISANSIERIFEGPDHNIWVTLSTGGFCQLHSVRNQFTFHQPKLPGSAVGAFYIRDIQWDELGNSYLLTFKGAFQNVPMFYI